MTSRDRLTLVVLAAGAGSRYGGSKQLAPVGPSGETLLEYAAFDALRAGFERVVLVVRPETEEAFRLRLDGGLGRRAPVSYRHQRIDDLPCGVVGDPERKKPWGTGHAVLAAAREIMGPFAVVNADDFYGLESYRTIERFLTGRVDAPDTRLGVLGFPVRDTLTEAGAVSRAILKVNGAGELEEIVELPEILREGDRIVAHSDRGERTTLSGDELVSMNMWGLTPGFLAELERRFVEFLGRTDRSLKSEFVLPEVVGEGVRDRSVAVDVLPASGTWFGMTYSEDRRLVERRIASLVDAGDYPRTLWA